MGTTSTLQLPYPELTDAANVPADMKDLADRLELLLADSGWITGGTGGTILAADPTNLTLTSSYARTIGKRVQIYIGGTFKVAVTVPTSGDIANVTIGQLAAAYSPAPGAAQQAILGGTNGRMLTGNINNVDGLSINAVAGSVNIAAGDTLSLSGSYLI